MTDHPFIDMHAHMFNAKYLPLDGILRSWNVPGIIAKPVTKIMMLLVSSSDFSKPINETLDGSYYRRIAETDVEFYRGIFKRLVRTLQKHAQKSIEDAGDTQAIEDAKGALEEIVHQFRDDGLKTFTLNQAFKALADDDISEETLLETDELKEIEKALFWALQEVELSATSAYLHGAHVPADPVENPASYFDEGSEKGLFRSAWKVLRFVAAMMDSERQIFAAIQEDYAKGAGPDSVAPTLFLNVMMDMEMPYKARYKRSSPPEWEFREQIVRMKALEAEAQGRVVTFAAVDPFRDYWETYLDFAISSGVTGVKIYPPMGFRAANDPAFIFDVDEDVVPKKDWPNANSALMEARLAGILRKIEGAELRLFTHCTPTGFEAKTGFGLNADPAFWDQALTKYELENMWLCLAHGGGTRPVDWQGWGAKDDDWSRTFASRVVLMCRKYPNVYCDLGYLLELFEEGPVRDRVLARLKSELLDNTGLYPFSSKVTYGADWHMLDMIGRAREYVNIFYRFFDDPDLSDLATDFFEGNARRYLGLPPAA